MLAHHEAAGRPVSPGPATCPPTPAQPAISPLEDQCFVCRKRDCPTVSVHQGAWMFLGASPGSCEGEANSSGKSCFPVAKVLVLKRLCLQFGSYSLSTFCGEVPSTWSQRHHGSMSSSARAPWQAERADRLPSFLTPGRSAHASLYGFLMKRSDALLQDTGAMDSVRAIICPDIEVHHQVDIQIQDIPTLPWAAV